MREGDVVIVGDTGQVGTLTYIGGPGQTQVLLRNGDVWTGDLNRLRLPQDQAEVDAAPLNVERVPLKRKKRGQYEI